MTLILWRDAAVGQNYDLVFMADTHTHKCTQVALENTNANETVI